MSKEFKQKIFKIQILSLFQVLLNYFNVLHSATSALVEGIKKWATYGTLGKVWMRYVCWTWLEMLNSLVFSVTGQMSQFS